MNACLKILTLLTLSANVQAATNKLVCGDLDTNMRPYHSFLVLFDDSAKRAAMGAWFNTSYIMRTSTDHAEAVPVAVSANLITMNYKAPLGGTAVLQLEWKNAANGIAVSSSTSASAMINQLATDSWKGVISVGNNKFVVSCFLFPVGIILN